MIADFVNKRGGGLLMLGGRRSFAEGGWAGTPVGEVLPVVLESDGGRQSAAVPQHAARPADARRRDLPRSRKSRTPRPTRPTRWNDMPEVSAGERRFARSSPARRRCSTRTDKSRQDQIVLAYQRYGRGKALAMPIQDSWLWRMDAKMAVEDTTHATFWRRLVRWLVDGVPDPVEVTTTQDRVEPGEAGEDLRRGRRLGVHRRQRQPRRRHR